MVRSVEETVTEPFQDLFRRSLPGPRREARRGKTSNKPKLRRGNPPFRRPEVRVRVDHLVKNQEIDRLIPIVQRIKPTVSIVIKFPRLSHPDTEIGQAGGGSIVSRPRDHGCPNRARKSAQEFQ